MLVARLQADYPGLVEQQGDMLVNVATGRYWRLNPAAASYHPLHVAALLVQEDLAVMMPELDTNGQEHYVLAAAAICFADQWVVPDKLGLSLTAIHAPAAHYTRVAPAVDKFFRGLRPGGEKIRYNFTFCERPDLHIQEPPEAFDCPMPTNGLPHSIYIRIERQALIRLPRTQAVLFTIRTYQQNVADVLRQHRAALLATLEPSSKRTPLSADQKDEYAKRIRSIFARSVT